MSYAHCRIGCIDALTAVAGGTIYVNSQFILINIEFHFFHFSHYGHGYSGSMNAALRLRDRYTLDTMNAAFVLQAAVCSVAFNQGDNFFKPAGATCRRTAHYLYTPALSFRIPSVHSK